MIKLALFTAYVAMAAAAGGGQGYTAGYSAQHVQKLGDESEQPLVRMAGIGNVWYQVSATDRKGNYGYARDYDASQGTHGYSVAGITYPGAEAFGYSQVAPDAHRQTVQTVRRNYAAPAAYGYAAPAYGYGHAGYGHAGYGYGGVRTAGYGRRAVARTTGYGGYGYGGYGLGYGHGYGGYAGYGYPAVNGYAVNGHYGY